MTSTSTSAASGSRSAAAKAATTGCAQWLPRWVPRTFNGCASGSAVRPDARTPRRSCWKTSPPPSALKCPRFASRLQTLPSCSSNWGWNRRKTASTPGRPREFWLLADEGDRSGPPKLARRRLGDGAGAQHHDVARPHVDLGHHFVSDLVLDAAHLGRVLPGVGLDRDGERFARVAGVKAHRDGAAG